MDIFTKLSFSVQVMILGLLIVFVGLVILIGAIRVLSGIMGSGARNKKVDAPAPVVAPAAPAPVIEAANVAEDIELIAVISAALAAYEGSGKKLVVRSVRRLGGNGWAAAGRNDQMGI